MATGTDLIRNLFKTASRDFSLTSIDDFPHSEYATNLSRYEELDTWYSGSALEVYLDTPKNEVEKYPIRVNPLRGAALKHTHALFGEFPDEVDGPLAQPTVKMRDGSTTDRTEEIESALFNMWAENHGAALQIEAGIDSQIYGGTIIRLAFSPQGFELDTKILLEKILPSEFIGIPYASNPWMLKEAWLIRKITRKEAEEYGVVIHGETGYYIEHWRTDTYEITINDVGLAWMIGSDAYMVGGNNPFGVVPFVYIPHLRHKGFYGDTLFTDAAKGLTREINSRLADAGDAVSDDTHSMGIMKNVRGNPTVIEPVKGMRFLNIGSNQTFVSGEGQPDVIFPNNTKLSDPALQLTRILYDMLRREIYVPAVADGEDEGSQRSALTLTTRMWPLVSHTKQERAFWATGIRILHRIALIMWNKKKMFGITPDETYLRLSTKWYPILPRDRENLMTEIATRAANKIGSRGHLMSLAGDIENIPQELEDIKKEQVFEAELGALGYPEQPDNDENKNSKKEKDKPARKETA